jgi:Flp pilus assembly protein TadD
MRGIILFLVLALAACGPTTTGIPPDQQSLDMARAAMRGGSPQTALQILSDAAGRGVPQSVQALVLQGDALTQLGRPEEAEIAYNAAVHRDRKWPGALIGLGRLKLATDPAMAETYFLAAVQSDPRNTTGWNDLGVARDLQGHHDGAQQAYRQALGIDPQLSAAVVNLALSLAMNGKGEEGVRMLRPLASGPTSSPKIRHDLAAALTMAGRRDEAAQILNADLSPDDVRKALDAYVAAKSVK